jgi:hypothetical protein
MLRLTGDTIQQLSNDIYSVYIYDNQYTGSTSTCLINSLFIDRPNIATKFQVIRVANCNLTLVSEYADQYDWLRTANMQRFKIVVKCNADVVFDGYLKTEQFNTTMSNNIYTIEFHFNNALNLLQRYKLTDDQGQKIKGQILTKWQILQYCLNKINLEYLEYLYIKLTTTCNEITPSDEETLFHGSYLISDTFYDEENEVCSSYDALEMLLKGYVAYIKQVGNTIVITDHIAELQDTGVFKKYSLTDYSYLGQENLNLSNGDISDYSENDMNKEQISSYNSVKLNYSPYYQDVVFNYQPSAVDIYETGSTVNIGTDSNYKFRYKYYNKSYVVNHSGTTKMAEVDGMGQENGTKSEFVLIKQNPSTAGVAFDFNYEFPFFITQYRSFTNIKFGLQVYFRTKDAYQAPENIIAGVHDLYNVQLHIQVFMNDLIFQNNTFGPGRWDVYTGGTGQYLRVPYYFKSDPYQGYVIPVNDQWIYNKHNDIIDTVMEVLDYGYIQLMTPWPDYNGINGKLNIRILDSYEAYANDFVDNKQAIKDIWIKKIELSMNNKYSENQTKSDIQLTAYMNPDFENEAPQQKLLLSDTFYRVVGERGAIYYSAGTNYDYISTHTRQGITANLSKLYLRSWISNYNDFTYNLSGTINRTPELLGYMTYDQLPGKKFLITGIKSDILRNQHQITLTEMVEDTEPITEL